MLYGECVDELGTLLNTTRDKHKIERFNNVIDNLNSMGYSISTKFIRSLLSKELTSRQKTYKIKNIVFRSKFKIERIVKYFKEWLGVSYNTEIKDYSYKKDFNLTEYDRINQLNLSRIDFININTTNTKVSSSFIGTKSEVFYFLI
jgi:hypothetical protein